MKPTFRESLPFRVYSAGIADFANIRQMHCIYADKTDLVYRLANECRFAFLSRPRRFGKSLLCSTLKYYFQGRRDLFEGLMISDMEEEWRQYPVLHFDLSACKNLSRIGIISNELRDQVNRYAHSYGVELVGEDPGQRLKDLIINLYKQTGMQVVLIFDEYDAPLLDYLHRPDDLEEVRRIMQEFYQPVKICDQYLRFCFLTGITKFSHLSIFSTLNNLRNISMTREYSALCGITAQELETTFAPDIELLAQYHECTPDEMKARLKFKYDGYRFCEDGEDIYNPFSLTSAFRGKKLDNYWFGSGTPTYLFEQMRRFGTNILDLKRMEVSAEQFDVPTESMTSALPLLYQSGYLTIKGYNRDAEQYILDFPNAEVRTGFMYNFMQQMMHIGGDVSPQGLAGRLYASLKHHDTDAAMRHLQAFFASIPYMDHGADELKDIAKFEAYYEVLMYVVFSIVAGRVQTQVKTARGRADVVISMPDATYVMELKVGATAQEALAQINSKDYSLPYEADGRVVKIGIGFSHETRTLSDWAVE